MLTSTMVKSVCTLAGVVVLATGCAQSMAGPMSGGDKSMTAASATPAASLRVALNSLLGEHVILAAAATGAALDGRDAEFKAAAGALDANSVAISKAIGSVYGEGAEQAFLPLWRRHIGFAVDYMVGVATKDQAKQEQAVQDLTTKYVPDFASFLAGATGLPQDALTELITDHVLTTKAVVDAQAGADAEATAAADQLAAQHMQMIGDPLSAAIVAAKPGSFQ